MFKIRSLGLFQPSCADLLEICLLYSLPRVEFRGGATWKSCLIVCEVCCSLRTRTGLCIITPPHVGIYTLHISQGPLHWSVWPASCSKCFQPAHYLVFKEVGKEITPERAKNYFSLLWCFKTQMCLMYDLISNCRIPTLIEMSTANHKLTHN